MKKLIFILVDGLGLKTALGHMGFLEGQVAHGAAQRVALKSALPSMSRPLYETIHTGLTPAQHGITSNEMSRPSQHPNVFSEVRDQGGSTGAAAYWWISELYNGRTFDPYRDAECDTEDATIQHGRFYRSDAYPDTELFCRASAVIERFRPDYFLVHPMGCDYVGHCHGGASERYQTQATSMDAIISLYLPYWQGLGYNVVVSADHGMNAAGFHGGTEDDVRLVPFYWFGGGKPSGTLTEGGFCQTAVAPTLLQMMGLKPPESMITLAILKKGTG